MCTRGREPSDYLVALRHLVVDRVLEIRECVTELAHELGERGDASHITYIRMAVLVTDEVGPVDLPRHRQVPFAPYFVDSAPRQILVLLRRRHRRSFPRMIATGNVFSTGIECITTIEKFAFMKSRSSS